MRLGISCYPTYGGSGVVASELALRLVAEGHCVHVLSYELPARLHNADVRETSKGNSISRDSSDLDSEPALYFHRVAVHQYPLFDYPPYSLALANEMVQVARRFELDLMHVHYAVPNAVSALLAKQILAPQRLPVVTTLHGTDITLVGNDPSYLETTRWSIANSDAVTAVSEWLELETREQFGGHRGSLDRDIAVIPNFVGAERFAQCQPLLGDEPVLVHVSNFRRVKRVDAVLEAFARLREQRAGRLRMVGEGPQRDGAMQRARDLGVADAVDWIGNHPQIEHALDGCALFLLASKQESFGLAALEALAAGLPVVAPRVGGLPDVVTDGVTGRLVAEPAGCDSETADTEASLASAMAEAAAEILGNEETWTGMSRRARADAAERFSVQAVLDQYVAVYNEVLKLRA